MDNEEFITGILNSYYNDPPKSLVATLANNLISPIEHEKVLEKLEKAEKVIHYYSNIKPYSSGNYEDVWSDDSKIRSGKKARQYFYGDGL